MLPLWATCRSFSAGCQVPRYVFRSLFLALLTNAHQAELAWWATNRAIQVTSPYTNQTYSMAHHTVSNSSPRLESYVEDYLTVHDPTLPTPLADSEAADLYRELASGAETGWDCSSRFLHVPQLDIQVCVRLTSRTTFQRI